MGEKPENKKKIGNVSGAEWHKRMESGGVIKSYSFQRSYKDKEGKYQNTGFFGFTDLLALQQIISEFIQEERNEQNKTQMVKDAFSDDNVPF